MARNTTTFIDSIKNDDKKCLPCPFCGIWDDGDGNSLFIYLCDEIRFSYYYISCINCGCYTMPTNGETIEGAIDAWNKRHPMSSEDEAKLIAEKVLKDILSMEMLDKYVKKQE